MIKKKETLIFFLFQTNELIKNMIHDWFNIENSHPSLKEDDILGEASDIVRGLMSNGKVYQVRYCLDELDESYDFYYSNKGEKGEICELITHWMPL